MTTTAHNDHGHSHGPGADPTGYYLEQLLTLGACGALSGVAIVLYTSGRLYHILHEKFHLYVLLGGLVLLALVVTRGVCLWISVGEPTAEPAHEHGPGCGHDHHQHGPGCGHEHHEHAHQAGIAPTPAATGLSLPMASPTLPVDHGHSHSHGHSHAPVADNDHGHAHGPDGHGHGWAPWRIILLLLPVTLFFLDLPNKAMIQAKDVSEGYGLGEQTVKSTGEVSVSFLELERASLTPESRDFYSGKTVNLQGVFAGNDENRFTLTRPTMNCCAADAITLKAVILMDYREMTKEDPNLPRLDPAKYSGSKWVNVTGTVQFLQRDGKGAFATALIVTPTRDKPVSKVVELMEKPPANQFSY